MLISIPDRIHESYGWNFHLQIVPLSLPPPILARNRLILLVFFLLFLLFLFPSLPALSSTQFSYTPQDTITENLSLPCDITVGTDGRVVTADQERNRVAIHQDGILIHTIAIPRPSAVALASDGHLYVSSNTDRSVAIFDSSYEHVGRFGRGAGEFKQPKNITVDRVTGRVYVVDQGEHSVRIYSSAGEYLEKISDFPNLPQDAAIVGHELFVLDQPMTVTQDNAAPVRGARVKIYDLNDPQRTRTFGSYGSGAGQFVGPRGITSDRLGYIYITDSFHSVVYCFSPDGQYVDAIQNLNEPMKTPLASVVSGTGMLYVASSLTGDIKTFAIAAVAATTLQPVPDIRVNGQDGPVTLCRTAVLDLAVSLDAGDWENEEGDWLLTAQTPEGRFWYTASGWQPSSVMMPYRSDALQSFGPEAIARMSNLTPGAYTFYFGVDTTMNDQPEMRGIFFDQAKLTVLDTQFCDR